MGLHNVGNYDMSRVRAIDGHMNDGSHVMTVNVLDAKTFHQLGVSGCHRNAVHVCGHAVSADFLNIRHAGAVNFFSVGTLETLADGVGGRTLHQSGVFQKLFFFQFIVMHAVYLKHTLGQGTGFIKDNTFCLRKAFQIIGSLHQNSGIAGAADSGEKAEGDTDDKRTWTADDKEGQRPINPCPPVGRQPHANHAHKRRQDGQRNGAADHGRCIHTGKFGDKVFRFGLSGTGIFHQIQDL